MDEWPLRMPQIQSILRQSLRALQYLHDHGIAHGGVQPSNMLVQSIEPLRIRLCDMRFEIRGNDRASDKCLSDHKRLCRADIKALGLLVLSWLTENDIDCYNTKVADSKEPGWTELIRGMIEEYQRLAYSAEQCLTDPWLCPPLPKKRRRSSEGLVCNSEKKEADQGQCHRLEPLSTGQSLYTRDKNVL